MNLTGVKYCVGLTDEVLAIEEYGMAMGAEYLLELKSSQRYGIPDMFEVEHTVSVMYLYDKLKELLSYSFHRLYRERLVSSRVYNRANRE